MITVPVVRPSAPSRRGRQRIVVVSASIGAGHDGAAQVLGRRLDALGFDVERVDFLDLLPPGWGANLRDAYAMQLRRLPASWGWLLRAAAGRRGTAGAAAVTRATAGARTLAALTPPPAAVVSTYPLASQVLGGLRRTGRLPAPVLAVMTDPSVHPLCVAPGVDLHLAPNPHAAVAIRALRGAALAVGPIVDPAFRASRSAGESIDIRRRLGLPGRAPLAVVVAGSWGVGDVAATVRDIRATRAAVPVAVCGRNEALRRRLSATGDTIALGWVDDMPSLLRAADVVVHNAGGLSSLEAMAGRVPVISYRCLPGHGVANAAVLRDIDLSLWPRHPGELSGALSATLHGDAPVRQRQAYASLLGAPDAATIIADVARNAAADTAHDGVLV